MKPRPKPVSSQHRWQAEHARIVKVLRKLRGDIASHGERGRMLPGFEYEDARPDPGYVARSVTGSIEGTLSLLEELWQRCVSNGGTGR